MEAARLMSALCPVDCGTVFLWPAVVAAKAAATAAAACTPDAAAAVVDSSAAMVGRVEMVNATTLRVRAAAVAVKPKVVKAARAVQAVQDAPIAKGLVNKEIAARVVSAEAVAMCSMPAVAVVAAEVTLAAVAAAALVQAQALVITCKVAAAAAVRHMPSRAPQKSDTGRTRIAPRAMGTSDLAGE